MDEDQFVDLIGKFGLNLADLFMAGLVWNLLEAFIGDLSGERLF